MAKKKFVLYLASVSPRRREILRKMKIPFRQVKSLYREKNIPKLSPEELVLRHAAGKAKRAVTPSKGLVLGADTLVGCYNRIFGKPKNHREAFEMLKTLSGRAHWVYTGVALWDQRTKKIATGTAKTKVIFHKFSDEEILNYMKHVHSFDKAGAYAIQEKPRIVKRIAGSYSNVMGLPRTLLRKMLRKLRTRE